MTAVRMLQLTCDCSCAHLTDHGCHVRFPDRPMEGDARDVRAEAAAKGWEVLRHTKGRDVCPPCRIVEIQRVSGIELPGEKGAA